MPYLDSILYTHYYHTEEFAIDNISDINAILFSMLILPTTKLLNTFNKDYCFLCNMDFRISQ